MPKPVTNLFSQIFSYFEIILNLSLANEPAMANVNLNLTCKTLVQFLDILDPSVYTFSVDNVFLFFFEKYFKYEKYLACFGFKIFHAYWLGTYVSS